MIYAAGLCLILLLAGAAGLLRSSYERHHLKTEYYSPAGAGPDRLRIIFLSDVHDYLKTDGIDELERRVKAEQPDLILFGGDMFTFRRDSKSVPDLSLLLRLIRDLSGCCTLIYAEGNHEKKLKEKHPEFFESFLQEVSEAGGRYIDRGPFLFNGLAIFCLSLELSYYEKLFPGIRGRLEPEPDLFTRKLGLPVRDMKNVLLMHHPMYLKEAARWGADLVLSGHFHGGTIRLPFIGGLMTPQFQFFVKECAGVHTEKRPDGKEIPMIVSRGIGTHSVNIRINDLPEISVIEF